MNNDYRKLVKEFANAKQKSADDYGQGYAIATGALSALLASMLEDPTEESRERTLRVMKSMIADMIECVECVE